MKISHMIMDDKKGCTWHFPEEADVYDVSTEQILLRHVNVKYARTAKIKCAISSDTLNIILNALRNIELFLNLNMRLFEQRFCLNNVFSFQFIAKCTIFTQFSTYFLLKI